MQRRWTCVIRHHMHQCNVLNTWQLAICINHALLYFIKDAIGKELNKP